MNSTMLLKYENKWIALTYDRSKVIAASKNLKELHSRIKKLKIKNSIFQFVLPFDKSYSP